MAVQPSAVSRSLGRCQMHARQHWQTQKGNDMCIVVYNTTGQILGIGRDEKWLSELLSNCSDAATIRRFTVGSGNTSPMSDTE